MDLIELLKTLKPEPLTAEEMAKLVKFIDELVRKVLDQGSLPNVKMIPWA